VSPGVTATYESREVWFLTGSQHLYGPEVLDQVAANAAEIARALDSSDDVPAW
jgi:L-arabinose isomerase